MPGVFHSKQEALGESVLERLHGYEKWMKREHREDALGSIIVPFLGSKGDFLMLKKLETTHIHFILFYFID